MKYSATQKPNNGAASEAAEHGAVRSWLMAAYAAAVCFPATVSIGSLSFTGTRAMLLICFLPVLLSFLVRARYSVADACILMYTIWSITCLFLQYGIDQGLEPSGSHFIEVLGSYVLARVLFVNNHSVFLWTRLMILAIFFTFPFALIESFTGRPILLELLKPLLSTFRIVQMEPRLGLDRAQVIFEHPILYGVFCASAFSFAVLILPAGSSAVKSAMRGLLVSAATFLSLSSGAYISIVWQLCFMTWNRLFAQNTHRWRILVVLLVLIYLVVDALSSRSPFEVFITYFTFDLNSAFTRVNTWRYGVEDVWRHPIFGMADGEAARPYWLTSSVDNFWLLRAMRFGLPGIILLLVAVFSILRGAARRSYAENFMDRRVALAQLCTIAGVGTSMITVDLWNSSHSMFFFLLGSVAAFNSEMRSMRNRSSHSLVRLDS